jgi:hypothetical protein
MYFCAVETVRELGGSARVELDLDNSHLTLTVTAIDPSSRLADGGQSVLDRVLAWDVTVTVDAHDDGRARLQVRLSHLLVMAQTSVNLSSPNADLATQATALHSSACPSQSSSSYVDSSTSGGRRRVCAEPAGGLHPVHTRQVHVHQDQVRAKDSG